MLLYQSSLFFAHDAPVEEQLSCALMSGRAKECNREELGDCPTVLPVRTCPTS